MLLLLTDRDTAAKGFGKTLSQISRKLSIRDVDHVVSDYSRAEFFIETGSVRIFVQDIPLEKFSFVFFRKVGGFRHAAFVISRQAEKLDIGYADRLYRETSESGKFKQTSVFALNDLPVPKTYFSPSYDEKKLGKAVAFLGFPIVVKSSKAQRGEDIFLAQDEASLAKHIQDLADAEIILQEYIPNTFDYRVVVLENIVGSAEKRIRQDVGEFRNNISLGAKEEFIENASLDPAIRDLALQAANAANIQVAGVDIVVGDDGKPRLFEVNRCPGFTHDETVSGEIEALTKYLTDKA